MLGPQDTFDGDDRSLPFQTGMQPGDRHATNTDAPTARGGPVGYGVGGGVGATGLEHFSLNASFNPHPPTLGYNNPTSHTPIPSLNLPASTLLEGHDLGPYTPAQTCRTILPDDSRSIGYSEGAQDVQGDEGLPGGAPQPGWDGQMAPSEMPTQAWVQHVQQPSFGHAPAPAPTPLAQAYTTAPSPFNGLTSMPPPFSTSFLSASAPAVIGGTYNSYTNCPTPMMMTPIPLPARPEYRTMTSAADLAREPGTFFKTFPSSTPRPRLATATAAASQHSISSSWHSAAHPHLPSPSPFSFNALGSNTYGPHPPHTAHPAGLSAYGSGSGSFTPQQQMQAHYMTTPRAVPQPPVPAHHKTLRGRSKSYAVLPGVRGRPYEPLQGPPMPSPTRPTSSHSTISELPDLFTPHMASSPLEAIVAHDAPNEPDVHFWQNNDGHGMLNGPETGFQLDEAPNSDLYPDCSARALRQTASVQDLRQYSLFNQKQQAKPDQTAGPIQLANYPAPAWPITDTNPASFRHTFQQTGVSTDTAPRTAPALPLPDVQWMDLVNRVLSSSPDPRAGRVPRPDSLQAHAYTLTYDNRSTINPINASASASASTPAVAPNATNTHKRPAIRSSTTRPESTNAPPSVIGNLKGQARAAASPYLKTLTSSGSAATKQTRFTYELNDGTIVTSPAHPGRKSRPIVTVQPTFKVPEVPMKTKPPRKRRAGTVVVSRSGDSTTERMGEMGAMDVGHAGGLGEKHSDRKAELAANGESQGSKPGEDVTISGQHAEAGFAAVGEIKKGRKKKQRGAVPAPAAASEDVDMDAEGEEVPSSGSERDKVKYGQKVLYAKARKAETEKIRRVARQDKIQLLSNALMQTYGDEHMTWDRITILNQALVAVQECQALRKQSETDSTLQKKGRAEIARLTALVEELQRDKEDMSRRVERERETGHACPISGININAHPI